MSKKITNTLRAKDIFPHLEQETLIRKGAKLEAVKINKSDTKTIFSAYITTEAVDRDKEIVSPTGINVTNYLKNPIVLWGHQYSELPIGRAISIKNDGKGLIADFEFAKHEFAQKVKLYLEDGFPLGCSIGFIPQEHEELDYEKDGANIIYTKVELLEFSLCGVPSNPEALQLMISKGLIPQEPEEKEGRVLSKKTRKIIKQAIDALQELHDLSEPEPKPEKAKSEVLNKITSDLLDIINKLK